MHYLYFFLLATLWLLIGACSSRGQAIQNGNQFKYHISEHQFIYDTVYSSDLYDEYRYIVLETDGRSFVGDIKQIEINELGVFLNSNNMMFRFDMEGKLVFVINSIGKGPEEYMGIQNFSLDGDKLYIYDHLQYRLVRFDQKTGRYLQTIPVPYPVKSLHIHYGNYYSNRSQLHVEGLSQDDQILLGEGFEFASYRSHFPVAASSKFPSMYELYRTDEKMFWVDFINNKTYSVDSSGATPYIYFDFGDKNVPEKLGENPQLSHITDGGYVYSTGKLFENDNYIIGGVIYKDKFGSIIFDKNKRNSNVYFNIHNSNYYSNPVVHTAYGNYFYKVIPAWQVVFMKSLASEDPTVPKSEQGEQLVKVDKDDNPVIAVFSFK